MSAPPDFKRVILGLHQSAIDRSILKFSAELAQFLRLDMFGLFIEEPGMKDLGALSVVREFHMLGREWRPIELERLAREFELNAMTAQRLLTAVAASHRVTCRFEIVRAATEQAIDTVSLPTDILIVAEPRSPMERIIDPFLRLTAAAFRSKASVMLMPRQVARAHGPVVAIAAAADDPSITAGIAFAAATREKLVIIERYEETQPPQAHPTPPVPGVLVERLRVPGRSPSDYGSVLATLERFRERLIVLTRGALGPDESIPSLLASTRRVPVLVVEPMQAQTNQSERKSA